MAENNEELLERRTIRQRLDHLYACLQTCLYSITRQEGFQVFCGVISNEIEPMVAMLSQLKERYLEQLPIRLEEPEGVVWADEHEKVYSWVKKLKQHEFYADSEKCCGMNYLVHTHVSRDNVRSDGIPKLEKGRENQSHVFDEPLPFEYPFFLTGKLEDLLILIDEVEDALMPIDDADIYAQYSKRELQQYVDSGLWTRDQRKLRKAISSQTIAHKEDYFREQRDDFMDQLLDLAPNAVCEETRTVYHEGLGRVLWNCRQDTDKFDIILQVVKSAEYYSKQLSEDFTFIDHEPTEEELTQPETILEAQKAMVIQNRFVGLVKFTCSCEKYFANGYDEAWIEGFWTAIIDSPIVDYICTRLSADSKKYKVQCQIIGELKQKGVFVGSDMDLAKAIHEGRKSILPDLQTVYDYIRHPFTKEKNLKGDRKEENEAISAWIQAYSSVEG